MAKGLPKNYTFSVSAKTITLTDITTVRLDKLALITDTTTNKILYNFADSTVATATVATNVITLSVLQGGEANSDKLRIDYDIESSDTSAFADTIQPVSGTVTADTELPTAAALADTTANPTVPAVGSFLMGWDNANTAWDRLKQQGLNADAQPAHAKGVLETASNGYVYNGTTWDRVRGDTTGTYAVGNVASGATDSGNPVKVGGKYNATMPTLTDGQRGDTQLTTRGAIKTTLFANDTSTTIRVFADNADAVATTSTGNALGVVNRNTVYNGTTWDRMPGDTTGVFVKNIAGSALIGKVGIDQTTPGTTNNTTNRDVTYAKFICDSSTLVANTMKTATLTVSGFTAVEIEITNVNGASTIYYTLDNTTPSSTNFSGILPATPCSTVIPCNGTPTLKLISAGTPIWGASVRGV